MNMLMLHDRLVMMDSPSAVHHLGGGGVKGSRPVTYLGSPPALGLVLDILNIISWHIFMSLCMYIYIAHAFFNLAYFFMSLHMNI